MKSLRLWVLTALVAVAAVANAKPPNVTLPPLRYTPPRPDRVVLSNGVVAYLKEDHELPLLNVNLRMKSSPALEPVPDAFSFFSTVWRTGGTEKRTPTALNAELEFIGASVETGADGESVSISLDCLSKDTDQGLDIFGDVLFHPAFREDQISLEREQMLEALRRKNESIAGIGRREYRDALYGPNHYYAHEPSTTTVNAVRRSQLVEIHKTAVVPDGAIITVAGDFNKADMVARLEKLFAGWKPTGRKVPPYDLSVASAPAGSLFLVPKDFTQSRVMFGRVGFARHDADEIPMQVVDYIIGGGGPSRLFADIRSRMGLAYAVGSFFTDPTGPGMIGVVSQTRVGATAAVIEAINKELARFQTGASAEELTLAKDAEVNSFVFGFDSAEKIAERRAGEEFYGYPSDYLDTYTDKIKAVTTADVERLAKKYYRPDAFKIIVVGNPDKFDKPLTTFGKVVVVPIEKLP